MIIQRSGGTVTTLGLNVILRSGDPVFVHIADGDDLHIRHGDQAADLFLAAAAQADHTGTDGSACLTKLHLVHLIMPCIS